MILYCGTIRYPEGVFERLKSAIDEVIDESRAEPGCITYSLARDVTDPDQFFLHEMWADQAAFDAHYASDHVENFRRVVEGIEGMEISITRYDARQITPAS